MNQRSFYVSCSLKVNEFLKVFRSYVLKYFVTAQWGGGGNTFRCCTEWPTSKSLDFFSNMRRQAVGAIVQLSFQELLFVGQSSLRSDSRSTAKSITTSALSSVSLKLLFRSDREQVHRCSCNRRTGSWQLYRRLWGQKNYSPVNPLHA